ncbi:MAG: hypothetical protein HYZ28_05770 [Myxococcales bacterium]|nr:hypothetical protein [Myxococcales bacterium]
MLLVAAQAAAQPEPKIHHEPPKSCALGEPVAIRARITSPGGLQIFEPAAYVRTTGASRFARFALVARPGYRDTFMVEIGPCASPLEYYLEAFDVEGHGPARAGSPEAPFRVQVTGAPKEPLSLEPPPTHPPLPPTATVETPSAVAEPAPELSAPAGQRRPVGGYLALGGAGLLLGGGVWMGVRALSAHGREKVASEQGDLAGYQRARAEAKTSALIADLLYAGAAASGAVGLYLVLAGGKPEGLAFSVSTEGVGLRVSGGF